MQMQKDDVLVTILQLFFYLLVFLAAALSTVDGNSSPCCLFDCKVGTFLANLPWQPLSILIFEHAAGPDIEDLGGK